MNCTPYYMPRRDGLKYCNGDEATDFIRVTTKISNHRVGYFVQKIGRSQVLSLEDCRYFEII